MSLSIAKVWDILFYYRENGEDVFEMIMAKDIR
jgi:hypothetical protein